MPKRKTESTSDNDEVRSSKKPNNSINQSYIKTANLMSKTKLFHKGLNSSTDTLMTNIKVENASDNESEDIPQKNKIKSKVKRKDIVTITNPDSDDERDSAIALLVNEKRETVLKNKSKKSHKRSRNKQSNTSSPEILPNIKKENLEEVVNSDQEIVNGSKLSFNLQKHEDEKIVTSVENKINILQDINITPSKTKTLYEQLIGLYPNLTKLDIVTKMRMKDSEDFYLLRVPKSVNPLNMLNLDISLEEACKINVEGEKFIIKPTPKIPHPTLILGNKTDVLNFKGNLVMEKYIKSNKGPNIPEVEKTLVLPPENLKVRHPLFGSHFKEKIRLDEAVERKLDEAIENLFKPTKSKKNKNVNNISMGHSTLLPDVSTTDNLNFGSISPMKKSKKKKALENDTTANDDYSFIVDLFKSSGTEKYEKAKINKKSYENGDDSISNELNDEVVTSKKKTKKFKIKEEPLDTIPKKKKKK